MNMDIFISYSREADNNIADKICEFLESNNVKCWIAPRDVVPGQYARSIRDAIVESDLLFLVFSNKVNFSNHVRRELDLATNYGKTIIPFKIEEVKPGPDIEYYLASMHSYEEISISLEKRLSKLLTDINNILNKIKEDSEGEKQEKDEEKEKVSRDFFKGIYLPTSEIEFLQELMSALNTSEDSIEIIKNEDDIENIAFNEIGIRLNEENRISGLGINSLKLKEVPKSILNLEKTYTLVLYDAGLKEFPEIICEMESLDFLDLSGTDIEYLPESIKDLDGIQVLDLSNNNINMLPKSMGTMEFGYLFLTNNNIISIPESFKNIHIISSLELDGNPVISNPDLRSRYILSYLETEDIFYDFKLPEISFKNIETDEKSRTKAEDMIYDYHQLNICKPSETYINTIKQDRIIDELIDIGYTAVDFLINEWLMGYEDIKPIAEEILDLILLNIAPDWREKYHSW